MADKYVKLNDIIDTIEHEWGYEGLREELEELPTADVVEVVRCSECGYFEPHGNGKKGICRHPKLKTYIKNDIDFCSYGERKQKNDLKE